MIWIPLAELRNYYLANVDYQNNLNKLITGTKGTYQPSLTDWITYWRNASKDKNKIIIYNG